MSCEKDSEMSDKETNNLIQDEHEAPEFGFNAKSKLQETGFIMLLLIISAISLCIDLIPLPFFTHEAKKRGLVEVEAGIILSCYDVARFIAAPLSPMIVQKMTPRKSILFGACLCGLACIAFGLVGYIQRPIALLILCIICRLLSGCGAVLLNVAIAAVLMQSKSYTNATIFGWIEMAYGAGSMSGGALGGALFKLVGYNFTFVIAGGVLILLTLPVTTVIPREGEVQDKKKKNFIDLVKVPGMIIMILICTMGRYTINGMAAMIGDWISVTFDLAISTWSLYWSILPLIYLLTNLLAVWTTNKGFVYSALLPNWFCQIVCLFFLCPSPLLDGLYKHKHYFPLTFVLLMIAANNMAFVYVPLFQAVLSLAISYGHEKRSANTYAMISGMFNGGWALGAMMGPVVAGALTQTLGFPWTITISAFLNLTLFLALLGFLLVNKFAGRDIMQSTEGRKS